MHAADRLARRSLLFRTAQVAQQELIGGERDRFTHGFGSEAFGQSRCRCFGRLIRSRFKNRAAEMFDSLIAGRLCPEWH